MYFPFYKCICHTDRPELTQFSSVAQSCPTLRPHELQHARPPCPSPTPGVHSDSCLSSQCCHPAISSLVIPFSSCPQSLPASECFPMSQLFAWGGQSAGFSALASFLPKKSQGWSPSEWICWISLQFKGLSRVFSSTTSLRAILRNSAFKWVYLSFSPLPFSSLLFSAIHKASSENYFAFLHFFFLGAVLINVSCRMSWTSIHSSSGILSTRSNPLNLFINSTE